MKNNTILMKMDSKEDNTKLAKFVCQLFKKREKIINGYLGSLSTMLD